ncbi:hypothetical protein GGE45_003571 [Rhizobium aethiopicum]|uniref:Uncharacterized protein n=1 Tax=Rhizobium aethiopicum TaxID=1138170 RepID=A0A7W6VQA4_9HYPH|nr:hypothetical protein [Rhizobium aethiopicum]MBB4194052.1 hypothetical protein [Rhizobium aethiopicum]MBB4581227.1 hypothetical protein [Rhizobium aethiopicum]
MANSIEERQRALLEKIATDGVEIAYRTAIDVCQDPKSTSPARATAAATLFRVAGFFERRDPTAIKEPHEMTSEELAASIRAIEGRAKARNPDIFD